MDLFPMIMTKSKKAMIMAKYCFLDYCYTRGFATLDYRGWENGQSSSDHHGSNRATGQRGRKNKVIFTTNI